MGCAVVLNEIIKGLFGFSDPSQERNPYGGKGMYGDNVHREVLLNRENKSGITIHFVDDKYDCGKIIFQKSIAVSSSDDINSLKERVGNLERLYFPKTIEKLILEECQ